MNAAVGLMDGLRLDGDRCIRVIPRHSSQTERRVYKTVSAGVTGGKDQRVYLRFTSDPDYLSICRKSETIDTQTLDKGICLGDLPV